MIRCFEWFGLNFTWILLENSWFSINFELDFHWFSLIFSEFIIKFHWFSGQIGLEFHWFFIDFGCKLANFSWFYYQILRSQPKSIISNVVHFLRLFSRILSGFGRYLVKNSWFWAQFDLNLFWLDFISISNWWAMNCCNLILNWK